MPPTRLDARLIDDAWVLARRGPRNAVDPYRPYACLIEPERTPEGKVEDVATVFLTNKECPFRCVMCDLWRNTTPDRTPVGAVATQVAWALANPLREKAAPHIKLYNSGNFFDAQSVPTADLPRIAGLVTGFKTVTVECHPRLIDRRCLAFSDALEPALHLAMGLETADPAALAGLNKRMTLADYERATRVLVEHGILVRAFILLPAPFHQAAEGVMWAKRSIDFAFSIGVECCVIVPTRITHPAMDELRAHGAVWAPSLETIEDVLEYGVTRNLGRVFVDLWDIHRFAHCDECRSKRVERLEATNFTQKIPPKLDCPCAMSHASARPVK